MLPCVAVLSLAAAVVVAVSALNSRRSIQMLIHTVRHDRHMCL